VLALLGPGDYFGEGCLTGVPFRMSIATAVTATTVLVIDAKEMIRGLHEEQRLSDRFIAYLLTRIIRVEEDLVDLVFNSIEKRLARALLLLHLFFGFHSFGSPPTSVYPGWSCRFIFRNE
jgi:CRP/FNR family cyclic AMP-dependent transcriptional regulator